MTRYCPFDVLTKVEITELEKLRDVARKICQNGFSVSFDHWVEVRSDGIAFCFESPDAALLFNGYCISNGIEVIIPE